VDAASGATRTTAALGAEMTIRPPHVNAYEFVVVSALRAQQLLARCTPRLPGTHSATTMAQMEVADGLVARDRADAPASPPQCGWQR
jgi:DNA-directed RNA polymerase subunit K/omega